MRQMEGGGGCLGAREGGAAAAAALAAAAAAAALPLLLPGRTLLSGETDRQTKGPVTLPDTSATR